MKKHGTEPAHRKHTMHDIIITTASFFIIFIGL